MAYIQMGYWRRQTRMHQRQTRSSWYIIQEPACVYALTPFLCIHFGSLIIEMFTIEGFNVLY